MTFPDQDGDPDQRREQDKERQLVATRARFSSFTRKNFQAERSAAPGETGLIPLIVFWCVVMGLLYAGMTYYLQPRQAQVNASGELIIQRAADGHFYAPGRVQGLDVTFLVDTGASLVTVSDAFARKAHLAGGTPTTFRTANGDSQGRVVEGVTIAIGPVEARNIRVGVGLRGGEDHEVLLGQSFLSKFDIALGKDQMVLKPR